MNRGRLQPGDHDGLMLTSAWRAHDLFQPAISQADFRIHYDFPLRWGNDKPGLKLNPSLGNLWLPGVRACLGERLRGLAMLATTTRSNEQQAPRP
ncbi:MAG: hypothetical protein P8M22_00710 [Phycisphaerales bacterium]|nr:hypothetical protein [Phycisphaerales bacterium]